jgi:hypothetical protein
MSANVKRERLDGRSIEDSSLSSYIYAFWVRIQYALSRLIIRNRRKLLL